MRKQMIAVVFSIAMLAAKAASQTVTSSGTTGTVGNVPYISSASSTSTTLSSSPISVSSGNIGIGTTSPSETLTVSGGFIGASTNSGQYSLSTIDGPTSPIVNNGIGAEFGGDQIVRSYWGVSVDINNGDSGDNTEAATQTRIPGTSSFTVNSRNSSSTFQTLFTVRNSGNVGIGTTLPAYNLDVAGVARAQAGIIYPDGNKQTTAWTGVLCGGDYAEAMNAVGGKSKYEPGDVLVLASGKNSDVQKSAEPYSTMVAGIFATKPGVIGRRDALAKSSDDIPMAMVGVVPTKVSVENGPIHKGDLLVSSSTPGYAMKGTDRSRMLGAVIGKAMGSLDAGMGVIEVLVTLQ